ncbi:MAG: di-heme oxidoredictase family protein [Gemmatimonadaceae bacterium]
MAACRSADHLGPPRSDTASSTDPLSGGASMTVQDQSSLAFGRPGPTLTPSQLAMHNAGEVGFEASFVPGTGTVNSGLGPRFDNVECSACHLNEGRGVPTGAGQTASMLFRSSVAGSDAHGGPAPAPGFGTQIQLQAVPGLQPKAVMTVTYTDSVDFFADGTPDTLHVPHYALSAPYVPLPAGIRLSPRRTPPVFGIGLLEAVPADTIEALAAAQQVDGGPVGHANYVWDPTVGAAVLGRFGLKANVGSVLEQTAAAYNADMGVTSSVFPVENCDDPVPGCAAHPAEATDSLLAAVTAYVRTLAVPARRNVSATDVLRGQTLFTQVGCASCHVATLHTGTVTSDPELSGQRIHPYTDLLLHDMGPGLADGRPDYLATGTEWRTTPLWGIGLTTIVNGHTNYLHDGRARSLLEAIMWHDGQAAAARGLVRQMSQSDRNALIAFLMSL